MSASRFEVWVSDTGEASHWKPASYGIFVWESAAAAIRKAETLFESNNAVCVEEWIGSSFVRTVWEKRK